MFVVLGIAGLVLPFLQGILFIAIGILLLARESMWVKRVLVRLRRRYPETAKKFTTVGHQARAFIERHRSGR